MIDKQQSCFGFDICVQTLMLRFLSSLIVLYEMFIIHAVGVQSQAKFATTTEKISLSYHIISELTSSTSLVSYIFDFISLWWWYNYYVVGVLVSLIKLSYFSSSHSFLMNVFFRLY